MIELKKLFDLRRPVTEYKVTRVKINDSLKLEDHKFYFVYEQTNKIEKKVLGLFKKTVTSTERWTNVVVSGGSSDTEIIREFNYLKCIPGETVLDLNGYFNISGECLISKEENQDGSYDLTRLPNVELTFYYVGKELSFHSLSDRISFKNEEDLTEFLKYLVDSDLFPAELFQNQGNTELIMNIDKYILNYIEDGK